MRQVQLVEIPEGRKKRNTAIKHEAVSPMTSILELSSQYISAHEIDGPRLGVDLDEVDVIKQQAANTAKAINRQQNVEVFPFGGMQETPARVQETQNFGK